MNWLVLVFDGRVVVRLMAFLTVKWVFRERLLLFDVMLFSRWQGLVVRSGVVTRSVTRMRVASGAWCEWVGWA